MAHSCYTVSVHFHPSVTCLYARQFPYPCCEAGNAICLLCTGPCFRQATCDYSTLSALSSISPKFLSRKEPSCSSVTGVSKRKLCPDLFTVAQLLLIWVLLALGKERFPYLKLARSREQSTPAVAAKAEVACGLVILFLRPDNWGHRRDPSLLRALDDRPLTWAC